MARIRSVKPEYWLDRKLARGVSRDARLLYIGLWNYADEHGRLHGDPAVIKGEVFPYDDDVCVPDLLRELCVLGRVEAYEYDGDPYLYLPKLAKHQRLEPAKAKSRLPEPPDPPTTHPSPHKPSSNGQSAPIAAESEKTVAESAPIVVQQVAGSRLQVAGSREHVAGGAGGGAPPRRGTRLPEPFPISQDLRSWAKRKSISVDLDAETEQFADHHRGKGTLSKDWPATWRTWMRNAQKWAPTNQASPNRATQRTALGLAVIRNLESKSEGEIA